MSKLSAFLHPVTVCEEREIVVSPRFVERNEKGDPILDKEGKMIPKPFKIRAISQEESDSITKQSRRTRKVNGQFQEYIDPTEFSRRMVVAATVEPDFTSTEMCEGFGVLDPLLVPAKMLLSGEFSKLLTAITQLSGFDSEDVEQEAKN